MVLILFGTVVNISLLNLEKLKNLLMKEKRMLMLRSNWDKKMLEMSTRILLRLDKKQRRSLRKR